MLQNDGGFINMVLNAFGLEGTNWLYNTHLVIPIVVLVTPVSYTHLRANATGFTASED